VPGRKAVDPKANHAEQMKRLIFALPIIFTVSTVKSAEWELIPVPQDSSHMFSQFYQWP